ncbi:MAG: PIN domain-containing protein [Coriobacteriia bacterium]|nr:PIN domain-containing protein [Coriobacteriia bacterium]
MGSVVLDAQPLVALVLDEPSAGYVADRLRGFVGEEHALISAVNWCEVIYATRRVAGEHMAARVAALMERAGISVVDVDRTLAGFAASVKAEHRLGLGDSFAAGLALATGLPLLTGDSDFLPLEEHGLQLDFIGGT